MVGVGKYLWRSSGPASILKLCHLELVAQDCVQVVFEYLQEERFHNLLGQPVPMFDHCHSRSVS